MSNTILRITFIYESRIGTLLYGKVECFDFDQATEAINKIKDWCDGEGFTLKRADINEVAREEQNI